MTIDEAIAKYKEKAKRYRILVDSDELIQKSYDAHFDKLKYEKCTEENEQLAEWLEELKVLRENSNGYSKEDIELNRKAMYNKALDDLIEAAEKSQYGDVDGKEYVMEHLKALAERLKAGGENEQSI